MYLNGSKLTNNAYKGLINKEAYETFDYAEFLKNNEKFEESISYYTKVINEVKKNHKLYVHRINSRM